MGGNLSGRNAREQSPFYADDSVELWHGDCLEVMCDLPDASVDAVVTDPPYGLGFMGREWDSLPPGEEWARECLRVLKPGGHLLAFGGTRTWHRLTCAVEDAGFEVRDSIAWLYGSGFPKSLDVSKAIDKANGRQFEDRYALGRHIRERREALGLTRAEVNAWFGYRDGCEHWERQDPSGARVPTLADWAVLRERMDLSDEHAALVERVEAEREVVGRHVQSRQTRGSGYAGEDSSFLAWEHDITAPATPAAQQWQGWGTALKPAFEPIVVGRKPLVGTVAANVLAHGTGALNIDGCRTPTNGERLHTSTVPNDMRGGHYGSGHRPLNREGEASATRRYTDEGGTNFAALPGIRGGDPAGRWPTNVLLDGDQADELDRQSGIRRDGIAVRRNRPDGTDANPHGIYSSHLRSAEPDLGYGGEGGASRFFPVFRYEAKADSAERPRVEGVAHPTVKPLDLMRWLVRLVTPPGGTVLEPFAGSGTTAEACVIEGFRCIAIEREAAYLPLIVARLSKPIQPDLFGGAA